MNCLLGKAWHRLGRILNFRNLKKERTADCRDFNKISITTLMYCNCSFRMSKAVFCTRYFTKENSLFQQFVFSKLTPNCKKQVFLLCSGHGACSDEKISKVALRKVCGQQLTGTQHSKKTVLDLQIQFHCVTQTCGKAGLVPWQRR